MSEAFLSKNVAGTVYCGCVPCGVIFETVDIIVSGFTDCGCVAFPNDDTSLKIDHVTGITGGFTGSGAGGATSIGTAFIQPYGIGDQNCATPIGSPSAADVALVIRCVQDRLFPEITIVGFGLAFQNLSGGLIGEIIGNDIGCAGETMGIVGTVQIFLP